MHGPCAHKRAQSWVHEHEAYAAGLQDVCMREVAFQGGKVRTCSTMMLLKVIPRTPPAHTCLRFVLLHERSMRFQPPARDSQGLSFARQVTPHKLSRL